MLTHANTQESKMSIMELKIYSKNTNGLGNEVKRQAVFDKLNRKGPAIFMLQETHCVPSLENIFKRQFGSNDMYFSNGTSNSCGVLTAISKGYEVKVLNVFKDNDGRYLIMDIERNGFIYRLGNIYAPTRNNEHSQMEVLKSFTDIIYDSVTEHIITAGDWNLYMTKLDKLDVMPDTNDNNTYRQNLNSFLETNNMIDAWRTLNPTTKMFTWHRGNKRSRLDYIFCSEHLLNNIAEVSILPGIHSDHSLLYLNINSNKTQNRGKGFWKFNSNLLHDILYVQKIKQIIHDKKLEYNIHDLGLKWDLIKLEIRNFTIPYCSRKKKANLQYEKDLNEKYHKLFNTVHSNEHISSNTLDEYNNVKNELENIEKEKSRGIILRSKVKWTEEGEKNTAYFLRLEKSNYNNKHIEQLIDSSTGELITDPSLILQKEKEFYQNLYKENNTNNQESLDAETKIFENLDIPKLTDLEKLKCEELINEIELLKAVKALKNGRSPGSDGLTSDFYKFFWTDIKDILLDSLNYDISNEKLSIEKRRGILTLIPKKDKNRLFLKNWRPISLLNTDYKILAKVLSNRLIKYLPQLVEDDQTGYISGRFIGCNVRLVEDVIIFTSINKITGILLVIDFEKAFDTLRWSFIQKALEAFNFGDRFRSFVKTMYTDIATAVINNGYTSDWFKPERGVRQGCPLSPYLFLLSVEILACKIRQNKNIEGLIFNGIEIKICQLADDTTCFIKNENSLKHLLDTFRTFNKCAGLGMNTDKTSARRLGDLELSDENLMGLHWTQEPVHTLGINISGKESDHYELNFKPKIIKMQQLLNSWKCRYLSLKGKITVINTLALSQIIYLCSIIKTPDIVYSEVKKIIVNFIWDGKTPKIAYNTLTQDIEKGGLKLIDLKTKVKSLSMSWIKRLNDGLNGKWKAIPSLLYKTNDLKFYFACNSAPVSGNIQPQFYKFIQNTWSEITQITELSAPIIYNQYLWNNRYITINNSSFLWRRCKDAGIIKISDIYSNNNFLNANELSMKYNLSVNFLEALQIRQSLPYAWRNLLKNHNGNENIFDEIVYIENKEMKILMKSDSKKMYSLFNDKNSILPTCLYRWQNIFPHLEELPWKDIFKLSFNITRETSLQSFQYKILHRTITCRKKLHEMRLIDNPLCPNCGEVDDLSHFFIQCNYVKVFWTSLFSWLNNILPLSFSVNKRDILFGINGTNDSTIVANYVILHAKYFIYRHRIQEDHTLHILAFKALLKHKLAIEKMILEHKNPQSFVKFQSLFHDL